MTAIHNRKPKVLFVVATPPPYAGTEIANETLLNSSLGEELNIIHLPSNLRSENSERGVINISALSKTFCLLIKLIITLIKQRPQAVYTLISQSFLGFLRDSFLVVIAKVLRRKVILHLHGANFHNFYKNQNRVFKKYIKFILKLSDAIILQAHWLKDIFRDFVPGDKLHVIRNAVSPEIFKNNTLKEITDTKDNINILYLNHISVAKGFLVLADVMKQLVSVTSNINFLIAGDVINTERNILFSQDGKKIAFDDINQIIDHLKQNKEYQGRIKFLGNITNKETKYDIFKSSDIFILPSYSEGCPLSVLEAMAFGLPVIVTPVGSLSEIIKNNLNGLFMKPGNSLELKERIINLTTDHVLRRKMGENNRILAESNFSTDSIIPKIAALFKDVCRN